MKPRSLRPSWRWVVNFFSRTFMCNSYCKFGFVFIFFIFFFFECKCTFNTFCPTNTINTYWSKYWKLNCSIIFVQTHWCLRSLLQINSFTVNTLSNEATLHMLLHVCSCSLVNVLCVLQFFSFSLILLSTAFLCIFINRIYLYGLYKFREVNVSKFQSWFG